MNKKIITSMGLPVEIRNITNRRATIELNAGNSVVCRYHPNNSVYLGDAKLTDWYPVSWLKKVVYHIRIEMNR